MKVIASISFWLGIWAALDAAAASVANDESKNSISNQQVIKAMDKVLLTSSSLLLSSTFHVGEGSPASLILEMQDKVVNGTLLVVSNEFYSSTRINQQPQEPQQQQQEPKRLTEYGGTTPAAAALSNQQDDKDVEEYEEDEYEYEEDEEEEEEDEEELPYSVRCAADPDQPAVWESRNGLNRMFERIVDSHRDQVTIWSRPPSKADKQEEHQQDNPEQEDPLLVSSLAAGAPTPLEGPWIISMENFVSPEEALCLIEWGYDLGYERSEGVGDWDEKTGQVGEGGIIEDRTSTNTWCTSGGCQEDPIVQNVTRRIENLIGMSFEEHSEDFQLLKYEVGEFYNVHTDYIDFEWNTVQGPRILTVYMYLNDVEEGGETRFAWFDDKLVVQPKLGRVVLWPSVLDEDPTELEERTEHEAMPVIRGQKFGANAWFHLRSRSLALERGC